MTEILLFGTALAATAAGLAVFRRLGARGRMLDVPNERSSHSNPTPRGGGIVIVIVCLTLYSASAVLVSSPINWSFVFASLIVAGVSWIDDLISLPAFVRLIVHGAAAAILIAGCGAITDIYVPVLGKTIEFGPFAEFLSFIWIIWLVNAYNFMDGIDGIAGAQAVSAALAWGTIGLIFGDRGLYLLGGIIAFSALGFLLHNWSPARVFMGDVGSAFLGFTFAAMPMLARPTGYGRAGWLATAAIGFVWMFLFDSVITFIRRLSRGEKVWLAHRQHLYQRLVIAGRSHAFVSSIYALFALAISAAVLSAIRFSGIFDSLFVFSLLLSAVSILFLVRQKNVEPNGGK